MRYDGGMVACGLSSLLANGAVCCLVWICYMSQLSSVDLESAVKGVNVGHLEYVTAHAVINGMLWSINCGRQRT